MSDDDKTLFCPIGHYDAPPLPTEHALRRLWGLLQDKFRQDDEELVPDDAGLKPPPKKMLDAVASPPACGPLIEELDRTLREWAANATPEHWLQLIVLPPCDRGDVVGAWARRHDHTLVTPPPRAALLAHAPIGLPEAGGDGLVVVPRLERWFLRHRNGLEGVRSLLAALERLERHCVIGCNSWAWAYLVKATAADVVLPKALTPQPFDAARLHRWFAEIAADETTPQMTFRFATSGADVMATDDQGEPVDRYMKQLAARSLGIPWIAWQLWRESLRSDFAPGKLSAKARKATAGDAHTLWVSELEELQLPDNHEESALLVLQSLLIHDALSASELAATLPSNEPDVVPALLSKGYVERSGEAIRVRPAAYPWAREALKAAGFPVDTL